MFLRKADFAFFFFFSEAINIVSWELPFFKDCPFVRIFQIPGGSIQAYLRAKFP